MTCDEAAWDLDMLGHDFYLFTEIESGADAVICHADDDGHLELHRAALHRRQPPSRTVAVVVVSTATHHPSSPCRRHKNGSTPVVNVSSFFVSADTNRGNVVYRRYDGHYGLINPA